MSKHLRSLFRSPSRARQGWPDAWRRDEASERLKLTQARTALTAWLLATIILAGTGTRVYFLGSSVSPLVSQLALAVSLWIAGCGVAAPRVSNRLPAAALVLGTVTGCLLMIASEGGVAAMPWPSLMLALLASPLLFPVSVRETLTLSAVVLGGFYLAGVAGRPEVSQALVIDRFLWVGYAAAVSVAAAHVTNQLRREEYGARRGLEEEQRRSEGLLLNVLPAAVASRLKAGEVEVADGHPDVSVVFADLVGFTAMSARRTPEEVVSILNRLVTDFDRLATRHGLEKIKTIGDCYMVASGIPEPRADHAEAAAAMALDLLDAVATFNQEVDEDLAMRVGMHCGPVVAGVIGETKFTYDLWGDTVNIASRMESHGVPGEIQVTGAVAERLGATEYGFEPRGTIAVKGRGDLETFLLRRG